MSDSSGLAEASIINRQGGAAGALRAVGIGHASTSEIERSSLVRSGNRGGDVVAFERAVVGFFVEAADLLGVPKSVAAIYGICFATVEPLGFTQINERLELSSGSVSQGLKLLRQVGALKVVIAAVDRRERFTPDLELRKLILHFLDQKVQKQLSAGKGRLQKIRKAVPAGKNNSGGELNERIRALRSWHHRANALLPMIKAFLKLAS